VTLRYEIVLGWRQLWQSISRVTLFPAPSAVLPRMPTCLSDALNLVNSAIVTRRTTSVPGVQCYTADPRDAVAAQPSLLQPCQPRQPWPQNHAEMYANTRAVLLQVVAAVAWDSLKDRLVIMLQGEHPLANHALLYTTVQHPIMSAICVGPVFLPQRSQSPIGNQVGHGRTGTMAVHTGHERGTPVVFRVRDGSMTIIPFALRHGAAHSLPVAASTTLSGTWF
jgi:hypothetical protein